MGNREETTPPPYGRPNSFNFLGQNCVLAALSGRVGSPTRGSPGSATAGDTEPLKIMEGIPKLGIALTEVDWSRRHEQCELLGRHVEGEIDGFTRGVVRVVLDCQGTLEAAQHPPIVPFHLQVLEPPLQPETRMFFLCNNSQLIIFS